MKAIFAVSTLAAAIAAAPAIAADTEATTTFTGSMDASFSVDLANDSTKDVALVADDDDGEGYEIDMNVAVVNGPFSGSIGIEAYDGTDTDNSLDDDVAVYVGDITVTDGKLTFGQVGNLMASDEFTGEMAEAGTADVSAGFKYEVMEGATVQLQNSQPASTAYGSSYGLAAQYIGEAGDVKYWVEGEFSGSDGAPDGADPATFFGAAVTYTTDMLTVDAAVNNYGSDTKITEVAAGVTAMVAGATASVVVTDTDVASEVTEDSLYVDADVSYAIDAITLSAGYFYSSADNGDELTAGVAWAQDALSASADVTIENFDADTADSPMIELNVTYTSEAGVAYYADYALQAEEADAVTAIAETNMLTLGARYSF